MIGLLLALALVPRAVAACAKIKFRAFNLVYLRLMATVNDVLRLRSAVAETNLLAQADAHGYMTKPSSRSELAYDDYVAANPEFCPHCVAAVDQFSDCDGCSSRGYQCINQIVATRLHHGSTMTSTHTGAETTADG